MTNIKATIGLDNVVYAKITEAADGTETYGTVKKLAKAISASMSLTYAEASLDADDGLVAHLKEFYSGTLSFNGTDLKAETIADLLGATIDANGVVCYGDADAAAPVAIGFRSRRFDGTYEYDWLYRVQFAVPNSQYNTKGSSITVNTPTIEGTIMRQNKAQTNGEHLWKVTATDGAAIEDWFDEVYEPTNISA